MSPTIELVAADGTVYVAEPVDAWVPPDGFTPSLDDPADWDRSGVFYDDEPRPAGSEPLYRLTPARTSDRSERPTGGAHLLGVADIARRLGISRPRVWQLRRQPGFPEPAGRYGDRDVWQEATIRRWATANGRSYIEPATPDLDPCPPQSDPFDPGGWDRPGKCICGTVLPPQRDWHGAGFDWQHVRCPACDTVYVDEEEFFAIYEPAELPDAADESCARCRHERANDSDTDKRVS